MKAVAIKKDQTRAGAIADFQAMGILRCDTCGDDFVIYLQRDVYGREWICGRCSSGSVTATWNRLCSI